MLLTAKIKIKPSAYAYLRKAAVEVNMVWNWANEVSMKALRPYCGKGTWLGRFDLINMVAGASETMTYLQAATIQRIISQFVVSRDAAVKKKVGPKIKWRVSRGSRRSLGWIPIKPEQMAKRKGNGFRLNKKSIRLFESNEHMKFKEGAICEDALGDWYLCMAYEAVDTTPAATAAACGIDIGLKTQATCSDGKTLSSKHYREHEEKLADLQRRGHKAQAKLLHRKIRRKRVHDMHTFTRECINKFQSIYIGDVHFGLLKAGNKAKSAYDGATSMLKTQLQYKGQQAGRNVQIISEKFTTQACSSCGSLSGPAGRAGLVVRDWQCRDCGSRHDRDVNAAINICRLGVECHPPCGNKS